MSQEINMSENQSKNKQSSSDSDSEYVLAPEEKNDEEIDRKIKIKSSENVTSNTKRKERTHLGLERSILEDNNNNSAQALSQPCRGSSGERRFWRGASGSSRVEMSLESNLGENQSNNEDSSSGSDSGRQQKKIVKSPGRVSAEYIPAKTKTKKRLRNKGRMVEDNGDQELPKPCRGSYGGRRGRRGALYTAAGGRGRAKMSPGGNQSNNVESSSNSEYVLAQEETSNRDLNIGQDGFCAYENVQSTKTMPCEEIHEQKKVKNYPVVSSEYISTHRKEEANLGSILEKQSSTQRNEPVTKEIEIPHLKVDLLSPHFSSNTCSVYYDSIKGKIIIQGTKEDVESKQLQLLTEITKMQEQQLDLSPECFELFQHTQGKHYMDKHTPSCKWEVKDQKLYILSLQHDSMKRNTVYLRFQLNAQETVDVSNIEREKVEFAIFQCERDFLVKIKLNDSNNELIICGVKDDVQLAKKQMSDIVEVNKNIKKTFQETGLKALFYQKHLKEKIQALSNHYVTIEQNFVSEQQTFTVTLTGKCVEVRKVFAQISELSANVGYKEWKLQEENFEEDDLWLILKSQQELMVKYESFESTHQCVISMNIPKTKSRPPPKAQDIFFSTVGRPNCKVHVKAYGDVTKEQSDVLVCVLTEEKDLRLTHVGQAFNTLCPNLWKELKDKLNASPSDSVIVTSTANGNVACRAIIHVILKPWDPTKSQNCETEFRKIIAQVLDTADITLQAQSISFPVMGCGLAFRFPPSVVAKTMLETVSVHLEDATGPLTNILLLSPDAKLFTQFEECKNTLGLSLIQDVASKGVDDDKYDDDDDDDDDENFKKVRPRPPSKSQNIIFSSVEQPDCKVHVKADGDVTKEKSDVLVCVLTEEKDLRMTRVGQAFNSQCPNLWKELKDKLNASPSDSVIVTSTANGNVACRAIIHVILKPWDSTKSQNCETEFRKIIAQVLDTAENTLQSQSISFPVMGCGLAFRFPPSVVAKAMLETISVFFERGTGHLTNILLLSPDAQLFTQFEKCKNTLGLRLIQEVASKRLGGDKDDDDNVLPSPLPKSQNILFKSVEQPDCKVHVKADGDVTKEKSDVLVCVLTEEKDLRMTRVGQAFNSQCPNLWRELKDKIDANPSDSVIVTSTANGNVACRAIIHVILKPWDPTKSQNCETEFRKIIAQVLDTAENTLQAQSISFPVLGCGLAFRFPPSVVAKAMLEAVSDYYFEDATGSLTNVLLLSPDAQLFTQFEKCKNTSGLILIQEDVSSRRHLHTFKEQTKNGDYDSVRRESYEFKPQGQLLSSTLSIVASKDCSAIWQKEVKPFIRKNYLHTDYFNQEEIQRWPKKTRCHIQSEAEKYCVTVAFSIHPHTQFPGVVIKGKKEDVIQMKSVIQIEFLNLTKYLPKARLNSTKAPKRGTTDFLKYAASSDDPFPSYWTLNQSSSWFLGPFTLMTGKKKTDNLQKVDDKTFQSIKGLVEKTWEANKVGLGSDGKFTYTHQRPKVLSIRRVENRQLFEKYSVNRKHLFQRGTPSPDIGKISGSKGRVKTTEVLDGQMKSELYYEINEHYLFHGFKGEFEKTIVQYGLDSNLGNSSGMFGRGIYFAESSTKADQYSDEKNNRTPKGTKLTMLLSRVLLGCVFRCDENHPTLQKEDSEKLKRPPCTSCLKDSCHCNKPLFDSVMGDGKWIFREFVVYDSAHCYPEYLITYIRE